MGHKLTAMEEFIVHLESMRTDTVTTGISGPWQLRIVRRQIALYLIEAYNYDVDRRVEFQGADARALGWKLVGIQANVSKIEWDDHPESQSEGSLYLPTDFEKKIRVATD